MTELIQSLRAPGTFYPAFLGFVAAYLLLRALARRGRGTARWDRGVRDLERGVLALMILAMLLLAMLQIVLRNFFHEGLVWIDPLLRHLVLWIGVTGAVVATGRLRHIQMDVIGRLFPTGPRLLVTRITSLAAAGICAALARGALLYLVDEASFGSVGLLGIPTWALTSVLFFGFALMAARFASRAVAARETLAALLAQREVPLTDGTQAHA